MILDRIIQDMHIQKIILSVIILSKTFPEEEYEIRSTHYAFILNAC